MNAPISLLFFSRGRGHGHAIPDIEIADRIAEIDAQVNIHFVSYGTGAETFKQAKRCVIDLNIAENNSFVDSLDKCVALIADKRPSIVVAHEEFVALVAAYLLRIPSIFVSAWLPSGSGLASESLRYASALVVIEKPGIFQIPHGVTVQPYYSGPISRKLSCTVSDRLQMRAKLGIGRDVTVVLFASGGWASEEKAPVIDLIISAFINLSARDKQLICLSSNDNERLKKRTHGIQGITTVSYYDPIEHLIAASDIVITKGTRGLTTDAATVGVPSISLSSGLNPIDDILVPRIHSNLALNAKAVDAKILRDYIESIIVNKGRRRPPFSPGSDQGAERAAKYIIAESRRLAIRALDSIGVRTPNATMNSPFSVILSKQDAAL